MNTANFPEKKARKQEEAKARQAACDALTPQQRLAALDTLGFTASKERARLQKQLAALVEAQNASPVMVVHGSATISEPTEPKSKSQRQNRKDKRGAR